MSQIGTRTLNENIQLNGSATETEKVQQVQAFISFINLTNVFHRKKYVSQHLEVVCSVFLSIVSRVFTDPSTKADFRKYLKKLSLTNKKLLLKYFSN